MSAPVILHIFGRNHGLPDSSPFCMKAELYLRMTGTPYRVTQGDVRKAPRGKLPWAIIEGRDVPDSSAIIERLEAKSEIPLDAWLSEAQKSQGRLVQRMLEDGTYFLQLTDRWKEDDGFIHIVEGLKAALPALLRPILVPVIRKSVVKAAIAQGAGRLPRKVRGFMAVADFTALAAQLGDNDFILGDKPSTFDATVASFVIGIMKFPQDGPARDFVRNHPQLSAYAKRMTDAYLGDLPAQS